MCNLALFDSTCAGHLASASIVTIGNTYLEPAGVTIGNTYQNSADQPLSCVLLPLSPSSPPPCHSQPPLLSQMIRDIVTATGNTSLAAEALPLLMEEHKYWTSPPKQVTVWGSEGKQYNLSR
jgi:hypothetical protein